MGDEGIEANTYLLTADPVAMDRKSVHIPELRASIFQIAKSLIAI